MIDQTDLQFAHSLQIICYAKSYPAGDHFLYNITWFMNVNMVNIELSKPRVTPLKYNEGNWGVF